VVGENVDVRTKDEQGTEVDGQGDGQEIGDQGEGGVHELFIALIAICNILKL